MKTAPKNVMAKDEAHAPAENSSAPDAEPGVVEVPLAAKPPSKDEQERYRTLFLAALTGFCCNASMGGAQHEELAATAAERSIAAGLDLHPAIR
jgi:hypothetical protein